MSYIDEVMADGPLAFWLLNESAGTVAVEHVADSRGLSRFLDGSYSGSPTLGGGALIGTGRAVETGAASYVRLPVPSGGWGFHASVEFWFEYVSGSGALFRNDSTGTTGGAWALDLSGTNPTVTAWGISHTFTGLTSASLKDGNRHHIVITQDGGNSTFYVDGSPIGTWPGADGSGSPDVFYLGKDGLNSSFTPAIFAAFAAYGYTLAADRVAAHFAAADQFALGIVHITTAARPAPVGHPGTATVTVTALPILVSAPVLSTSTLVLASSTVSDVDAPLDAPGLTVEPLHIVSPAIPAPTLVSGRPT